MLKVMHPNGALEWRYIGVDWYLIGCTKLVPVAVVATKAHPTALLATTEANRLSISADGGASYTPLGTDVTAGYPLGAFSAGQRKDYVLKVVVPGGTTIREARWELEIGEGT
jgi:hypothetical protein